MLRSSWVTYSLLSLAWSCQLPASAPSGTASSSESTLDAIPRRVISDCESSTCLLNAAYSVSNSGLYRVLRSISTPAGLDRAAGAPMGPQNRSCSCELTMLGLSNRLPGPQNRRVSGTAPAGSPRGLRALVHSSHFCVCPVSIGYFLCVRPRSRTPHEKETT